VVDTPEQLKRRLGAGDVVEVFLQDMQGDLDLARERLGGLIQELSLDSSRRMLRLRLLNAVKHLAAILDILGEAGFEVGEVNLRANTLEDVFIQLTGRSLRE